MLCNVFLVELIHRKWPWLCQTDVIKVIQLVVGDYEGYYGRSLHNQWILKYLGVCYRDAFLKLDPE